VVGVTTVALIERKPDISRDLFSRYWRDVHGVMAARIPGFATYTQYHVTPLSAAAQPFEGIAIVTFANEDDRQGLATSEVTQHIHRDEQNVFRRALLYNLDGASLQAEGAGDRYGMAAGFVVLSGSDDVAAVRGALALSGPAFCDVYDLSSGDPSGWNDTDVSGSRCAAVMHAGWACSDAAAVALAGLDPALAVYRLDEVHIMVEDGLPTPVGLRGLDAVRTIREAGADNQLSDAVVRAIYGTSMAPKPNPLHTKS
jgi:hypothetical protein